MKIFITFVLFTFLNVQRIESKLRLLSIVFRHGDRTPDTQGFEAYPNDPYANETFYPIGTGGLTNIGKMREYRLGQFLRKTYGDFLSPTYYPGKVDARSTFIDRTKMSLQLVLAALYPPEGDQKWNKDVNWQPIPTRFVSHLDDDMMFPQECRRFLEYLERVRNSPEYQAKLNEFAPLMHNLTIATGKNITSTVDMYFLYGALAALSAMDLELPEWSQGLFPKGPLYDGTLLMFDEFSFNDDMKRVNGGMLLRKITDDMTAACSGTLDNKRKVFLYSGHEFSVVAMLEVLGVYKRHEPRFSAAVIIELHKENRKCLIKVKHYKGIVPNNEPISEDLTVPGCSTGYLRDFKNAVNKYIATDDDIDNCDKRSVPEFLKTHKNLPAALVDPIVQAVEMEKKNEGKLM